MIEEWAETMSATAAIDEVVERLTGHTTLGGVPRAELEWLAAHGTMRSMETGEVLNRSGAPVTALYIVLAGRMALFVDRGAGPTKLVEWGGGDVTGMMPYSRIVSAPGESRALAAAELLEIPRGCLQEMTRECYEVTSILVHTMVDRTRMFTANDLHNEKMISLGKLSAGLAHELNNPASAIERCAAMLEDRIESSEMATRGLAADRWTLEQMEALEAVRVGCGRRRTGERLSALEQMDREEEIAQWLGEHELEQDLAGLLADSNVTLAALERLADSGGPNGREGDLDAAVRWAVSGGSVRSLGAEIQDCARRISQLVTAMKGFTHMDQGNVAEMVELGPGLADTVAVLRSRAQEKKVEVALEIRGDLPRVRGYAGELNQVWGKLIDNALDAVEKGGQVSVVAEREGQNVVVKVLDDGHGVAAEVRERIFDPFFTTKPMGQGTGLGLDIARRLVRHNDGAIEFESEPGRTQFLVRLPVTGAGGEV